ncbi:MAG: 2-oxo acid dehydrogenase subunit E2 [Actinomycetia bacterium]|nr:2-oxo acid dehydrogenase subunit E2 [Actinomycetes bacterium]
MADITMPQLGETVTEGTITRWFKQVGDTVAQDEVLFEVSTDKVDSEVPSPVSGVISEIVVPEGETVDVGAVLARVGDEGAPPAAAPAPEAAAPEPAPAAAPPPPPPPPSPEPAPAAAPAPEAVAPPPAPVAAAPASAPSPAAAPTPEAAAPSPIEVTVASDEPVRLLSPVVRRLISEHGLDPGRIQGTGVGGRISRDDVQKAIEGGLARAVSPPATPTAPPATPTAPAPGVAPTPVPAVAASPPSMPAPQVVATPVVASAGTTDYSVPLNNIRRRTGEHMVMSKAASPHVLTAIEVDYENVERTRNALKGEFKAAEGFSLTYLPFIARALVDTLRDFPHMNASMGDAELVVHRTVGLAIAVDLDFEGLVAPVVQSADGKRLRQLARDVVDLANRSRAKQLSPDDISGGTFTITNAGSFGTMMQFPIINQPQVAILSTDGIARKPVVITDADGNESIGIHSVGVLALAWDHRAFDGAYAAAFLARLKEIIETRDWAAELS